MKGILLDVLVSPLEDWINAISGKVIACLILGVVVWVIASVVGIVVVMKNRKRNNRENSMVNLEKQQDDNI